MVVPPCVGVSWLLGCRLPFLFWAGLDLGQLLLFFSPSRPCDYKVHWKYDIARFRCGRLDLHQKIEQSYQVEDRKEVRTKPGFGFCDCCCRFEDSREDTDAECSVRKGALMDLIVVAGSFFASEKSPGKDKQEG